MISAPIFIVGTERSGSNLLRLILNAHSEIAIPHPPHIMRDFSPLLRFYGNLEKLSNFQNLVHDVVMVVNSHFAPWPFVVNEEVVFQRAHSKRSLFSIYCTIYDLYLEHTKKKRWGCKSTFMYRHFHEICDQYAGAKFIHLVRDPRAVVASAKKSIFSAYQPQLEASLWLREQNEIDDLKLADPHREKLMIVRYEDLVENPNVTVPKIMAFLGVSYESQQLDYFQSKEATVLSQLSESWKNCGEPISRDRIQLYQKELQSAEIELVETITEQKMQAYGYPLMTNAKAQLRSTFTPLLQEYFLWWKAEYRSFQKDKNFSKRWKKKLLLKQIFVKRALFQRDFRNVQEKEIGYKF